jgi:hypothetical protein
MIKLLFLITLVVSLILSVQIHFQAQAQAQVTPHALVPLATKAMKLEKLGNYAEAGL